MRSLKPWFVIGIFFAALLGAASVMAEGLDTVAVARADLPRVYRLDGVAEAVSRGTVSGQTSGRVIAVNFDVDDYVSQGDVIVLIEDTEHQSRVDQALANRQAASARRQGTRSQGAPPFTQPFGQGVPTHNGLGRQLDPGARYWMNAIP